MKREKMLRITIIFVMLFVAYLPLGYAAAPAAEKAVTRSTFAGTPVGSPPYVITAAFAEAAKKALPSNYTINTVPGGSVANVPRVNKGEIQVGLASLPALVLALRGEEPFTESYKNLRVLIGNNPRELTQVLFIADAGLPFDSLPEWVKQKYPARVVTSPRSDLGTVVAQIALKAEGASYEHIRKWGGNVSHVETNDAFDLMKDRRVQINMGQRTYPQPQILDLTSGRKDLKLLSLGEKALAALKKAGLVPTVLKPKAYEFIKEEFHTVASPILFIVPADLPDSYVTSVLEGFRQDEKTIQMAHASTKNWTFEFGAREAKYFAEFTGVPLHPAAKEFFEKLGYISR